MINWKHAYWMLHPECRVDWERGLTDYPPAEHVHDCDMHCLPMHAMEFESRHVVFRTAPEPITLHQLSSWLDQIFIDQYVITLEVGGVFSTDFRDIRRTK